MEYKDYYALLGVDRKANEKEIKSAYRRLARKYHPDVNPGDREATEKFKNINEAYQVLGDPAKRARYDQLGPDWEKNFRGAGPGAGPGQGFPGGFRNVKVEWGAPGEAGDFSEFFRTVFGDLGDVQDLGDILGGRTASRRARRSRTTWSQAPEAEAGFATSDLEHPLEVSLEEAFAGGQRALQLQTPTGGRRLEVRIPAGVREGAKLRVAGQTGTGGDLYLVVKYLPHPLFQAHGDNLETEVPVTLYEALLGGEIEVPTMKGKATMKIPAGTQPGQVFRMRGQGLPPSGSHPAGDELVKVRVVLPTGLDERAQELVNDLAQAHPYKSR